MKTPSHKINTYKKYRFMFFNFGLVISLLLTITAFEWRFEGEEIVLSIIDEPYPTTFDVLPAISIAPPKPPDVKKPTKKPSVAPKIKLVKKLDPKKIEVKYVSLDTMPDYIDVIDIPDEQIENPDPERYPDIKAIPPSGFKVFYKQVQTEVGKSVGEREKFLLHGNKFRILVSFVIEIDGSVSNVAMLKGFIGKVNRAAMKSVLNSGPWKPAYKRGKRVSQIFTLPIRLSP